jgi:hypothetical protein
MTNLSDLIGGAPIPAYLGSFKNKIINGNFDIWQRGTSQTTDGYGSADRWRTVQGGSTTYSITQQSFTVGQVDVPNEPVYFYRNVVTSGSGASDYVYLQQKIEYARTLAGKIVTFSFYAKADSSRNMSTEIWQYFGSGGSTFVGEIGVEKHSLTDSWQKFTVTFTVPSISGKTISGGNDYLSVQFWFDAGSDFDGNTDSLGNQSGTFDIAQVQLEEGSSATNFEMRHIAQELALCQRYFEKWNNGGVGGVYLCVLGGRTTSQASGQYTYKVPKRVTPTVTDGGSTSGWSLYGTSSESFSSLSFVAGLLTCTISWIDTGTPLTSAACYGLLATNDTDEIWFDAEL